MASFQLAQPHGEREPTIVAILTIKLQLTEMQSTNRNSRIYKRAKAPGITKLKAANKLLKHMIHIPIFIARQIVQ